MSAGQELYLQIVLDENGSVAKVTNLGHAVKSVGSESEGTSKKVDKLTDSFSKNDSAIESFIDTLKTLGASYAALRIERMIEDWVKLDITQSQADQSLKSIMISTDRFSESFYQGTLKQAEALQKLTGVRDQDIERGQKMLMLYENISSDLMPRTTQAMVNLAALMEGDVRTAAFELGKAMDGETESLRRAGIIIDENVFKQRGAIGVLEEVEKKVNGQAVSLTEGAGKWKLLGTAIDEAKESIGAAFTQIAEDSGILQRTIDLVNKFTELMRSWGATPQQKIGWQIIDLQKLNSELVSAQSTLDAMKEHPLKGWLGEWLNEEGMESATQRVKSLNDEINRILTNIADTPTFLEKASKVTEDSLPPIKASTDAVRDWATAWANAKPRVQEITEAVSEFGAELIRLQWGLLGKGQLPTPGNDQLFNKSGIFGQPHQSAWENLSLGGFSTTLTPTPGSAQLDAEAEALVKRDLEAYDKAQAKIKAGMEEIKRQQDEIAARWNSIANQMGSSFTDALVGSIMGEKDAFKNLGKSILNQLLAGWVDRLITQPFIMPIINSMSGLFGYGGIGGMAAGAAQSAAGAGMGAGMGSSAMSGIAGAFGGTWLGSQGLLGLGATAGMGVLGYKYAGTGGAIGGALGTAVAGPIAGAVLGMMLGHLKDEEDDIPSFNLLWEVVNGQVKNVADTWRNMAKNDEVFNAAQEFVQTTTDFFHKLSTVTGNSKLNMPDWQFQLQGVGDNIKQVLNQQTTQDVMKAIFGSFGDLTETFGPGFKDQIQKIFMETMTEGLGSFVFGQNKQVFQNYMDWKFNQFTAMPSEQAMSAFQDWMGAQDIFSPVGRPGIQANSIFDLFMARNPNADFNSDDIFSQLEQFAKTVPPGWFSRGEIALGSQDSQKPWKDFFTDLNQQVTDIFTMVTTGMGQAFADSLDTGQFATFEQRFKQSIMGTVQQSLIESFANQNLIPVIFSPLYGGADHPAITEVLKQYQSGDITFSQAKDYLASMFGELNTTLQGFEPVWDILNTGFQGLAQALGLNTDAVQSNTNAVLGPVNSFLASLDTGPLAPVESMAKLSGIGDSLYTAAFANPQSFSEYANFMTQSWLPQQQAISSDYAGVVAGIRAQVEAMPWVAQAQGKESPTASDIGAEVAKAVAPMLLDLKETGQITINVVVDGQVIKQQVINSLNDPAVVQQARGRV